MFDDIFSRLDTIQYTNVTDKRTSADNKDRANAWRRAVKHFCTLIIITGYGVIPKQIRLNK